PKFLMTYESRTASPLPLFARGLGAASAIHGTEGTIFIARSGCWVVPNDKSSLPAQAWEKNNEMGQMNLTHWQNWMECIKTRQKPISEIETCVRSSAVCILAN